MRELSDNELILLSRERGLKHLLARCTIIGDCWIFQGVVDDWGYGRYNYEGKYYRAHRLAYQFIKGEIEDGMHLHHIDICTSKLCINPDHLELLTPTEHGKLHTKNFGYRY